MTAGASARLTVNSGKVIKIEKGIPRSRREQWKGLTDLKYIEVQESDPKDRFFFQVAHDEDVSSWPDGEYLGVIRLPGLTGSLPGAERAVFVRNIPSDSKSLPPSTEPRE